MSTNRDPSSNVMIYGCPSPTYDPWQTDQAPVITNTIRIGTGNRFVELEAMRKCLEVLGTIDMAAQKRVLAWLSEAL